MQIMGEFHRLFHLNKGQEIAGINLATPELEVLQGRELLTWGDRPFNPGEYL